MANTPTTPDYDSMTDDQLQAIAGGTSTAPVSSVGPVSKSPPAVDYDSMSDAQLQAIANGNQTSAKAPTAPAHTDYDSMSDAQLQAIAGGASTSPIVNYIKDRTGASCSGMDCGTGIEKLLGMPMNNGAIQSLRSDPKNQIQPDPQTNRVPDGTGVWFNGDTPAHRHYGLVYTNPSDGEQYLAEIRNAGPGTGYHFDSRRKLSDVESEGTHAAYEPVFFKIPSRGVNSNLSPPNPLSSAPDRGNALREEGKGGVGQDGTGTGVVSPDIARIAAMGVSDLQATPGMVARPSDLPKGDVPGTDLANDELAHGIVPPNKRDVHAPWHHPELATESVGFPDGYIGQYGPTSGGGKQLALYPGPKPEDPNLQHLGASTPHDTFTAPPAVGTDQWFQRLRNTPWQQGNHPGDETNVVKNVANQVYDFSNALTDAFYGPGTAIASHLTGDKGNEADAKAKFAEAIPNISGGALVRQLMQSQDPVGDLTRWFTNNPTDAIAMGVIGAGLHGAAKSGVIPRAGLYSGEPVDMSGADLSKYGLGAVADRGANTARERFNSDQAAGVLSPVVARRMPSNLSPPSPLSPPGKGGAGAEQGTSAGNGGVSLADVLGAEGSLPPNPLPVRPGLGVSASREREGVPETSSVSSEGSGTLEGTYPPTPSLKGRGAGEEPTTSLADVLAPTKPVVQLDGNGQVRVPVDEYGHMAPRNMAELVPTLMHTYDLDHHDAIAAAAAEDAQARVWADQNGKDVGDWYSGQRFERGAPDVNGNKGSFGVRDDGATIRRGLAAPDLSTAMHELGHAIQHSLSPDDLATVEKHYGVEDGNWQTSHHERFAEEVEKYFSDGQAPTPKLQPVFERIGAWLKNLYHSIVGTPLEREISPVMKDVLDRRFGKEPLPQPLSETERGASGGSSPGSPGAIGEGGTLFQGALNPRDGTLTPDAQDNVRAAASRIGALNSAETLLMSDKGSRPVATDADAQALAKSLNLSTDDLRNWDSRRGEIPAAPEGVHAALWQKSWATAVRNLHEGVKYDYIDASDAARDAAAAHDVKPTDSSLSALQDANVKEAHAQAELKLVLDHDEALQHGGGAHVQGYSQTPVPTRGTGYIRSLASTPSLEESLSGKKPTPQPPPEAGRGASGESSPSAPDRGNSLGEEGKGSRSGGRGAAMDKELRTVSEADRQSALAALRGDDGKVLFQSRPGRTKAIDFNNLEGKEGALVKLGKFHYENGYRGPEAWRAAMEKDLGTSMPENVSELTYRRTRAAIAQDSDARQTTAAAPLFKDQLGELGRVGAAQFLEDIGEHDKSARTAALASGRDVPDSLLNKIVSGKPITAYSEGDKAAIARHWEANKPVADPNKAKAPSTNSTNTVKQIVADQKAKTAKAESDAAAQARSDAAAQNAAKRAADKAQADAERAQKRADDATKRAKDRADAKSERERVKAVADAQAAKEKADKLSAEITERAREAGRKSVEENKAKGAGQPTPEEPLSPNPSPLQGKGSKNVERAGSEGEMPPDPSDEFLAHMSKRLGDAGAEMWVHKIGEDVFDRLANDTASATERSKAAAAYHDVMATKPKGEGSAKLPAAENFGKAVNAYRTARAIAEKNAASDPFNDAVAGRVKGGADAAKLIRADLEKDDVGRSAIAKLLDNDPQNPLTNEEGRRLAHAIDSAKRTSSPAHANEITNRLSRLMNDARRGRLGHENPLEAAKTQMFADANRPLEGMPPNANPARRAALQAKVDKRIAAMTADLAKIKNPNDTAAIGKVMMKHDDFLNQFKLWDLGNVLSSPDTGLKVVTAHPATVAHAEMERWLFGDRNEVKGGVAAGFRGMREKGLPEARQIMKDGSTAANLGGKSWYKPEGDRIPVESRSAVHRALLRVHSAYYQLTQTYNTERGLHLYATEDGKAKGLTGEDLADHVLDVQLHPERYKDIAQKAIEFGAEETQTHANPVASAISQVTGKYPSTAGLAKSALMPVANLPLNTMKFIFDAQTGLLTSRWQARRFAQMHPDASPEQIQAVQDKVTRRGAIGAGLAASGAIGTLLGGVTPSDPKHGRYVSRVNIGKLGFDVPAGPVGADLDLGSSVAHDAQRGDFSQIGHQFLGPYVGDNPVLRTAQTLSGLGEAALGGGGREGPEGAKAIGGTLNEQVPMSGAVNWLGNLEDRIRESINPSAGGVRKKNGALDYLVGAGPGGRDLLPLSSDKNTGLPYPQGVFHSYPRITQEQLDQEDEENEAKQAAGQLGSYALRFLRNRK